MSKHRRIVISRESAELSRSRISALQYETVHALYFKGPPDKLLVSQEMLKALQEGAPMQATPPDVAAAIKSVDSGVQVWVDDSGMGLPFQRHRKTAKHRRRAKWLKIKEARLKRVVWSFPAPLPMPPLASIF